MTLRIARMAMNRAATITAGLLLAAGALAALPSPASAASSVVSWWGTAGSHYEDSGGSYSCAGTWQVDQGAHPNLEVFNPCNARVWVHYYNDSVTQVQAYCISPGGGLAYAIPLRWSTGYTSNIQLTTNTSACDAGQTFGVAWQSVVSTQKLTYPCVPLSASVSGESIEAVSNLNCVSRMWLHEFANGSGATYCVNPGAALVQPPADAYYEVQETANQALCDAGGPPYSY